MTRPLTEADLVAAMPAAEGSGMAVLVLPEPVVAELAPAIVAAVEQRRGRIPPDAFRGFDLAARVFASVAAAHRARLGALPQAAAATGRLSPFDDDSAEDAIRERPPGVASSAVVAEVLHLSERRVRDLATTGRLPAKRIAGRWVFDLADVHQYERERDTA